MIEENNRPIIDIYGLSHMTSVPWPARDGAVPRLQQDGNIVSWLSGVQFSKGSEVKPHIRQHGRQLTEINFV